MIIQSLINRVPTSNKDFSGTKKNPFTSEILHTFFHANLLEAVTAIQQSQKFFSEFKFSSVEDRLGLLKKIKAYLELNQLKFARLEANDQGLPLEFVQKYSLAASIKAIDSVIEELNLPSPQSSAVGVVSIICSWNLSLRLVTERFIPAIAAGNTVVIKLSSASPVTALILQEIIEACDLPAGLIQIILSNEVEVKKILVTHPGIKAISFVGQLVHATDVIKWATSVSHQQFKKIQISSGSKNTAAALDLPTDGVFHDVMDSFLLGQGQLGWNSSRLFVLEKNEKIWLERINDYLSVLKPSESIDDPSVWTPIIKPESFKTFSEINTLAIADQARLLKTTHALNESQKNKFLPVTFTQDMSNCSTLQQDQVLAPLFIFSTVKYAFDIPKYSNVSYFGLAAHLWGEEEKLKKLGDALEVGLICRNKWSAQVFNHSKSVKQSGFGLQDYRAFGDFFSNVKNLA